MNWESEYERLVKAKYTKRTGSPGNYKYTYAPKKGSKPSSARADDSGQGISFGSGTVPITPAKIGELGKLDKKASDALSSSGGVSEAAKDRAVAASNQAVQSHFDSYSSGFSPAEHKAAASAIQDKKRSFATTQNEVYALQGLANLHTSAADSLNDRKITSYAGKDIHSPDKGIVNAVRDMHAGGTDNYGEGHAKLTALADNAVAKMGGDTSYHKEAGRQLRWAAGSTEGMSKPVREAHRVLARAHDDHAMKRTTKSVSGIKKGSTMGSLFDGWLSKGEPDGGDEMLEMLDEELLDDGTEDDAEKGALGAGYSSGMAQGAGYASSPGGGGAAAVTSAPSAVSTVAGGGGGSSKPASSPAPAAPAAKDSGGGGGIGATSKSQDADDYMNHGSGSCSSCQAGTCPHGTKKALTSRAMSIPFYLRPGTQAYDPEGIRRSATAQTSAQYSSLAPQVRESMAIQENISNARATQEATTKCAAHGVTYKSQNCPLCTTAKSLGMTRPDVRYGSGGNR